MTTKPNPKRIAPKESLSGVEEKIKDRITDQEAYGLWFSFKFWKFGIEIWKKGHYE